MLFSKRISLPYGNDARNILRLTWYSSQLPVYVTYNLSRLVSEDYSILTFTERAQKKSPIYVVLYVYYLCHSSEIRRLYYIIWPRKMLQNQYLNNVLFYPIGMVDLNVGLI